MIAIFRLLKAGGLPRRTREKSSSNRGVPAGIFFFSMAIAGMSLVARADFAPYTKVIGIAVVAPLSGTQRQYGLDLSAGVQEALDEANQTRGLTDYGWMMHSFDDQGDPGEAMQQAQFATIDASTALIIGHVGARETLSALPTYHQEGIPVIIPASPLASLTQRGYDNVFRICPTDLTEGRQDARYAERIMKAKRIAVVYEENDYGADAAQGFMNYTAGLKSVSAKDFHLDVESKRLSEVVRDVKTFSPDLIFVAGDTSEMLPVLNALRTQGLRARVLGTQSFYNGDVARKNASGLAGMTVSSCLPPLELMPQAEPFMRRYAASHGQVSAFAALGYVSAQVAMQAVRQARSSDRRTLDRQLAIGSFPTMLGSVSFQRNGDTLQDNVYFYSLDNGAFKFAGSAYPNPLVCDPKYCH